MFVLPELKYTYHALEPHFDTPTMELHHQGHHPTYVKKLNQALVEATMSYEKVESLFEKMSELPLEIRNNAGGHYNHTLFWSILGSEMTTPSPELLQIITLRFGILDDFKIYIENNYSNPNLNLELVSNDIGISSNYLSQIINANQIKFNEYLNNFRIEKAKEMILSNDYNQYTITSIGLEAGFNSNASFYRAFKKECGQSPTEYRKNLSQFL